ncbi:uncharacterized protein LOC129875731 [Solanum dulcamara]|uniref:uncharacterized protein LOC129875731 n=1 Tax=Solanum dulcamara TaxID=45834 RepID=UPI002485D100|nr:uncharacterized protein LOC129875731 [Solanum dulcamara]
MLFMTFFEPTYSDKGQWSGPATCQALYLRPVPLFTKNGQQAATTLQHAENISEARFWRVLANFGKGFEDNDVDVIKRSPYKVQMFILEIHQHRSSSQLCRKCFTVLEPKF